MWISILDKEREYVINFENVIGFVKTSNCKHEAGIEIFIVQGGITLSYSTEEERDSVYDLLVLKLKSTVI